MITLNDNIAPSLNSATNYYTGNTEDQRVSMGISSRGVGYTNMRWKYLWKRRNNYVLALSQELFKI